MFERRRDPLLPRRLFVRRLLRHFVYGASLIAASMVLGMVGYHVLAGFGWLDAMLNAAMLLGGMGPVGEIHTVSGKIFASAYALYAGLVFLVSATILLAPVLHRLLHWFHVDADSHRT